MPDDFVDDSTTKEGYCRTSSTEFYGNVQKLYFSWPYYNIRKGTKLTRKVYRNGDFLWEISNSAGEDRERWSLSRPEGHVWVLIDAQYRDGRLWELYHSDYLPAGQYRMELYVNDNHWDSVNFSIYTR